MFQHNIQVLRSIFLSFARRIYRYFSQKHPIAHILQLTLIILMMSVVVGSVVALFMWLLEKATHFRWKHTWIIFLLPFAGVGISWMYKRYGKQSSMGNNLIIDEIHEPSGGVPVEMTPLVLISTIITHLFGGSAGREGTAVQMGGSIAEVFAQFMKLSVENRKLLLTCGMAAGFGSVFGTPVAGAVFAIEVLSIGRNKYEAFLPCLLASSVAHICLGAYHLQHTHYHVEPTINTIRLFPNVGLDLVLLFQSAIAGILFGFVGVLFIWLTRMVKKMTTQFITKDWLIPVVGGVLIIILSYSMGSFDYLGLGVSHPNHGVSIVAAFEEGGVGRFSWLWKTLFTAITLGTGFKGGEVTPLFFVGATLGNTIGSFLHAPIDLFAGLGFIAVFAGAANIPIACTIMGIELFGWNNLFYYATACFVAYQCSGHHRLYSSQRINKRKWTYRRFKNW